MSAPHRFVDFAAHAWRGACPALRTFVWRPSAFHARLARSPQGGRFCDALRAYTGALFAAWPKLECVERPLLEDLEFPFTEGEPPYVAFVRTDEGEAAGEEYEARSWRYDKDMWKNA